jgi:hypothetical protein
MSSAPVQLRHLFTHDANLAGGRQRLVPQAVLAVGKRTENRGPNLATRNPSPQHLRVHALSIVTDRADLDLLAVQFLSGVDDEGTRSGADIHHHSLLVLVLMVVLAHAELA